MVSNEALAEPRTIRDQVVSLLRKRLTLGEMKAGELYSATTIAKELGVSSSPVREALLKLADQGMLEAVRNRGFRVTPMDEQDRREVHEIRVLLEIPTMQKLAGHDDVVKNQGEFRAIAHEMVAAVERQDYVSYLEADLRFHLGLIAISGNHRLVDAVRDLRATTRQGGLPELQASGKLLATAEEHFGILKAMVEGDSDKVGKLMSEHLQHVTSDWGPADPSLESNDDNKAAAPA